GGRGRAVRRRPRPAADAPGPVAEADRGGSREPAPDARRDGREGLRQAEVRAAVTVAPWMLGNAAAAAVLAALAAALSYFVRAPAVRHAAWVLVLLKLVTPPLFSLPLPVLPASWAPTTEPRVAGAFIVPVAARETPDA